MTLTFGSLFSGIGGIDLGLERAGMRCQWQVEIDPYALQILARHWPGVPRYRDVRYFLGGKRWRRARQAWEVGLIAGGFPCQDISNAGKRSGIGGRRSGLWSEFARVVRLLRPGYVLVENVPALTLRGLGTVLGDLAALGYGAEWSCLPAAAVGAPHPRWRLFCVAYRRPGPLGIFGDERHAQAVQREAIERGEPDGAAPVHAPHAHGRRCQAPRQVLEGEPQSHQCGEAAAPDAQGGRTRQRWRDEFAAYCEAQGRLFWPDPQPGICGVAHGVPHRVDRLRGLGNAVVPQLAEWIGRRILEVDNG